MWSPQVSFDSSSRSDKIHQSLSETVGQRQTKMQQEIASSKSANDLVRAELESRLAFCGLRLTRYTDMLMGTTTLDGMCFIDETAYRELIILYEERIQNYTRLLAVHDTGEPVTLELDKCFDTSTACKNNAAIFLERLKQVQANFIISHPLATQQATAASSSPENSSKIHLQDPSPANIVLGLAGTCLFYVAFKNYQQLKTQAASAVEGISRFLRHKF